MGYFRKLLEQPGFDDGFEVSLPTGIRICHFDGIIKLLSYDRWSSNQALDLSAMLAAFILADFLAVEPLLQELKRRIWSVKISCI